jgi:hypothetical protein
MYIGGVFDRDSHPTWLLAVPQRRPPPAARVYLPGVSISPVPPQPRQWAYSGFFDFPVPLHAGYAFLPTESYLPAQRLYTSAYTRRMAVLTVSGGSSDGLPVAASAASSSAR